TVIRIALQFPCFPAIKEMLRWRGIECGPCIRPRGGLSLLQAAELRRQLEGCGVAWEPVVSRA
ncbi:MAG TPA: hypothetical protein VNV86_06005, partial [Candidatus Acidoferrum sp.]|nr:hypothetical protein [Candidatus Acidoferrum sp.]